MGTPRTKIPDNLLIEQGNKDESVKDKPLNEWEDRCLSGIRISILIAGAIISIVVVVIVLWNLLAPEQSRWLSSGDLDKMCEKASKNIPVLSK